MRLLVVMVILGLIAACSSARLMKNCQHLGKQVYQCEDF